MALGLLSVVTTLCLCSWSKKVMWSVALKKGEKPDVTMKTPGLNHHRKDICSFLCLDIRFTKLLVNLYKILIPGMIDVILEMYLIPHSMGSKLYFLHSTFSVAAASSVWVLVVRYCSACRGWCSTVVRSLKTSHGLCSCGQKKKKKELFWGFCCMVTNAFCNMCSCLLDNTERSLPRPIYKDIYCTYVESVYLCWICVF